MNPERKLDPDVTIVVEGITPYPSPSSWDGVRAIRDGKQITLDESMRDGMKSLLEAGYLQGPIVIYQTYADGSGRVLIGCAGSPQRISGKGLSEIANWKREGCEVAALGPELALLYTPPGKLERYRHRLSFDTLFEYMN